MLLCIVFLVVALGITIYIHNLSHLSHDLLVSVFNYFKWSTENLLPFRCFYPPSFYNIIISSISSTYFEHQTDGVINSASTLKNDLRNSCEGEFIIFTPIFIHSTVLFFVKLQTLYYHFLSIWRTCFYHLSRVVCWCQILLVFFHLGMLLFSLPFFPQGWFLWIRFTVSYSFLSALEKCATFCWPPWFQMSNLLFWVDALNYLSLITFDLLIFKSWITMCLGTDFFHLRFI